MHRRHSRLPRLWLMTDERMGDRLWDALAALPRGSGVVFRHHHTPPPARRALLTRVARVSRARGLVLLVGGAPLPGGDGRHGRCARSGRGLATRPVHGRRELVAAQRVGVDAVFVSPVFPTRSHPGAPALGPVRFGLVVRDAKLPVIALGGMDARRARRLSRWIHGWAAIDAWADQKRKAVPR